MPSCLGLGAPNVYVRSPATTMRLFALPLSRRAALQTKGSASQLPLFYLHAQRLDEAQAQRLERELSKPQQWLNKATGWGATQWAKLGRNENEKSWQRRTHVSLSLPSLSSRWLLSPVHLATSSARAG